VRAGAGGKAAAPTRKKHSARHSLPPPKNLPHHHSSNLSLLSPLLSLTSPQVVQYEPVPCKGCGAILNPYAAVDFAARLWTCALCHGRNHFPPHYAGASESNLPAELFPTCTSIEYQTPPPAPVQPPAYVFVLDTCLGEDELGHARRALSGALAALPEYAQVGLVTFGTHVAVHELGFPDMAKAYVFQGGREHSPAAVAAQLGLGPGGRPGAPPPPRPPAGGPGGGAPPPPPHQAAGRRFILPLADAEFALTAALDDLARDAFPPLAECRPARCTGTAVSVAAALAAACLPAGLCAGRVLLFVGGPSTDGPGRVVERSLAEPIRSHKDLAKDAAPLFAKAAKFYAGVGAAMVQAGHALDVFACSLDQVGLAEMKPAIERTGGVAVQADTFANPVFRESLKRLLAPPSDTAAHLGTAAAATLEVIPSRDVRVCGALGPAAPADRRGPAVAETAVGMGGTSAWKMAGLDGSTAVTLFFEPAAPGSAGRGGDGSGGAGHASQLYLQIITRYLHATGAPRTRVTTLTRRWTDGGDTAGLVAGFDQEAAAVVAARLATHKMETEEDFDATRWLDRTLIRLCARFGEYRRDDPASFALAPGLAFFPQFLFNLRRSAFVQVFGSSPDETAHARLWLGRAGVPDGMVMVQPTLLSYGLASPSTPEPVLLDVAAVAPDRVLLLDSFFHVVVFHGATVAQWRKAGYASDPAHAALAALLEAPRRDAAALCRARFPVPRLVDCDQHGSQARFLLAKLNPSSTYNSSTNGGSGGAVMGGPAVAGAEVILTDDVSLAVFMEHLKKLAVQS
jgi:protein transport protein SEC23